MVKKKADLLSMTPKQCAAARALVGWTQRDLAEAAGVNQATVVLFEGGKSKPIRSTLRSMRVALERAGVVFIEANGGGPGVRQRVPEE
jgi:predicted transcriptional regulator